MEQTAPSRIPLRLQLFSISLQGIIRSKCRICVPAQCCFRCFPAMHSKLSVFKAGEKGAEASGTAEDNPEKGQITDSRSGLFFAR